MIIKIPSKNIYGDIVNNKTLSNKINSVSLSINNIYNDSAVNTQVWSSGVSFDMLEKLEYNSKSSITSETYVEGSSDSGLRVALLSTYIKAEPRMAKTIQIRIPKVKDYHRVTEISDNISISKIYKTQERFGIAGSSFKVTNVSGGLPIQGKFIEENLQDEYISIIEEKTTSSTDISQSVIFNCIKNDEYIGSANEVTYSVENRSKLPTNMSTTATFDSSVTNMDNGLYSSVSQPLNIVESVPTKDNIIIEDNDYFDLLSLDLFGAIKTKYAVCTYKYNPSAMDVLNSTLPSNIVDVEYTLEQVSISIYGNTIGINLQNGEVKYEGNYPFSISLKNELLQNSGTTINEETNESIPTSNFIIDKILNQYSKGKETATILCSIADYYDLGGARRISTHLVGLPMTFQEHDIVMPMVYTNKGDVPMSLNQDGSAKEFQVVQVEMIYDGAVWQKLTLQEYVNKE